MSDFLAWVEIAALIIGPISAVAVTRVMDEERARRERRMGIFRSLMKTRKMRLSAEHVSALNLVEIDFYGEPDIKKAWDDYFKHLCQIPLNSGEKERVDNQIKEQEELLTTLLRKMATSLGLANFEQFDIMKGGYAPQGWVTNEEEQRVLRTLLIEIVHGKRGLPITPYLAPSSSAPYPPPPDEEQESISDKSQTSKTSASSPSPKSQ